MRRLAVIGAVAAVLSATTGVGAQTLGRPALWISGPSDDEITAAWPAEARAKGVKGEAYVECTITEKNEVKDCKAFRESPANAGFGAAALGLIPRFKASAARSNSQPVASVTRFILRFPPNQPDPASSPTAPIRLPEPVQEPTDAQINAAWPTNPKANSIEGSATLSCLITLYGDLADCKVTSESRDGLGFGPAALSLTKFYKFAPGSREGMSVPMRGPVYINFLCKAQCTPFTPPKNFIGSLVSMPWTETPSAADLESAYPQAALAGKTPGLVMLFCRLKGDGGVRACEVSREEPAGMGFGAAALSLADRFKGPTRDSEGKPITSGPAAVQIPISFGDRPATPVVIKTPTAADFNAAFPNKALEAKVDDARVSIRCVVAEGGSLRDCAVASESPAGMGFGEAALSLAPKFFMTRWSATGRPTLGATVRIPLRFVLTDPTAAKEPQEPAMVITSPTWERRPGAADIDRLYPGKALRFQRGGDVRMVCHIKVDGTLYDCLVASESPPELGFGDAALKMVPLFKMKPLMVDGHPVEDPNATVAIPIGFRL